MDFSDEQRSALTRLTERRTSEKAATALRKLKRSTKGEGTKQQLKIKAELQRARALVSVLEGATQEGGVLRAPRTAAATDNPHPALPLAGMTGEESVAHAQPPHLSSLDPENTTSGLTANNQPPLSIMSLHPQIGGVDNSMSVLCSQFPEGEEKGDPHVPGPPSTDSEFSHSGEEFSDAQEDDDDEGTEETGDGDDDDDDSANEHQRERSPSAERARGTRQIPATELRGGTEPVYTAHSGVTHSVHTSPASSSHSRSDPRRYDQSTRTDNDGRDTRHNSSSRDRAGDDKRPHLSAAINTTHDTPRYDGHRDHERASRNRHESRDRYTYPHTSGHGSQHRETAHAPDVRRDSSDVRRDDERRRRHRDSRPATTTSGVREPGVNTKPRSRTEHGDRRERRVFNPPHTDPRQTRPQVQIPPAPVTYQREPDQCEGDRGAVDRELADNPMHAFFAIVDKYLPGTTTSTFSAHQQESRSLLTSLVDAGPPKTRFTTLPMANQLRYHLANSWREARSTAPTSTRIPTDNVLETLPLDGTPMTAGKFPRAPKFSSEIYRMHPPELLSAPPTHNPALKAASASDYDLPVSYYQQQQDTWRKLMQVMSFLDVATGITGVMHSDNVQERTIVNAAIGRAMGDMGALVTSGFACSLLANRDATLKANVGSTRLRPNVGASRVVRPLSAELLPEAVADEIEERQTRNDLLLARSLLVPAKRPATSKPRTSRQKSKKHKDNVQPKSQERSRQTPAQPRPPQGDGGQQSRGRGKPQGRGGSKFTSSKRGGRRGS